MSAELTVLQSDHGVVVHTTAPLAAELRHRGEKRAMDLEDGPHELGHVAIEPIQAGPGKSVRVGLAAATPGRMC